MGTFLILLVVLVAAVTALRSVVQAAKASAPPLTLPEFGGMPRAANDPPK